MDNNPLIDISNRINQHQLECRIDALTEELHIMNDRLAALEELLHKTTSNSSDTTYIK